MPPRTRSPKSSLRIADEVDSAKENSNAETDTPTPPEPKFDLSLLFHTDKGVDRVEIGVVSSGQIQSIMGDVSNAFNTLRANTSFLIQDTSGSINFFNLNKVSRIEFSQKVVS